MKLKISRSKNSANYYVQKSYRTEEGKCSTKTVERLGTIDDLRARFGNDDPVGGAKKYIAELTAAAKNARETVIVRCKPNQVVEKDKQRSSNGGYLFLQKIYHDLGLHKICKDIIKRQHEGPKNHAIQYDLNEILSMLIYTRIIYPGSKLASFKDAHRFIKPPKFELHQVYRALSLLARESDFIQAQVYKNSLKLRNRNTNVLYYDCTNYFFESEEEKGLRQYGHSKENRPNPIVQMGLFIDMDGFPLAFNITPGNTNEQVTLKPLEQKLNDNFNINKLVVCTDSGLSSYENRKNNHVGERAFITVQSLKKLKRHLQDWALDPTGWHISGSQETFDISKLSRKKHRDTIFYKDRWMNENGLEQRIIVTFSIKYQNYLRRVRKRQVTRAQKIIENGASQVNRKSQNDPKRFIQSESCTVNGELAELTCYTLNQKMISQEERFDGFYAVCTDLEAPAMEILRVNSRRWMVEDCFRIMKTGFEARPVYLQRDDRIQGHFLVCFLALLIYKYFERDVNKAGDNFSPNDIIGTLTDMNFHVVPGDGYIPTYTRVDLTDIMHENVGFRTDTEIVTKQKIRSIISATKNSRRAKEKERREKKCKNFSMSEI